MITKLAKTPSANNNNNYRKAPTNGRARAA